MLYKGKNSGKWKNLPFNLEKMNDERSWGKPKIHKASEKDDPARTFPDVEGFQKPVEPD
jgi:hypothetical protein